MFLLQGNLAWTYIYWVTHIISHRIASVPRKFWSLNRSRDYTPRRSLEVIWLHSTWVVRDFVKLRKFQKSEKNSEVGGGSNPNSDFFLGNFAFFRVFCVVICRCTCFQKIFKKWIGRWLGGVWPIRVFLGFLECFQLDNTPVKRVLHACAKVSINK